MRKQNKTLTCPECSGSGFGGFGPVIIGKPVEYRVVCYYCAGTGFQSDDDDSYEQFKGRE